MTILFLIKNLHGHVFEVCLAEKKRGFRVGKLNGSGGKLEPGETPKECAIRETKEELGVIVSNVQYSGQVIYEDINQIFKCFIYISDKWKGDPIETEEMNPDWYKIEKIPFKRMGKTDHLWITDVLKGNIVHARFQFDNDNHLLNKEIKFAN